MLPMWTFKLFNLLLLFLSPVFVRYSMRRLLDAEVNEFVYWLFPAAVSFTLWIEQFTILARYIFARP